MTKREKDKRYEFVRLCSSLNKQGFRFDRHKHLTYCLIFHRHEFRRLTSGFIKMPYVEAVCPIEFTHSQAVCKFIQWSDVSKQKATGDSSFKF